MQTYFGLPAYLFLFPSYLERENSQTRSWESGCSQVSQFQFPTSGLCLCRGRRGCGLLHPGLRPSAPRLPHLRAGGVASPPESRRSPRREQRLAEGALAPAAAPAFLSLWPLPDEQRCRAVQAAARVKGLSRPGSRPIASIGILFPRTRPSCQALTTSRQAAADVVQTLR